MKFTKNITLNKKSGHANKHRLLTSGYSRRTGLWAFPTCNAPAIFTTHQGYA